MKNTITVLLFSMFYLQGLAQLKYEKELRIRKGDVPANAISFVDSMDLGTKIRWYKEISYDKTSLEAKTTYKGERYSIEFSEKGLFEDVEIEINKDRLQDNIYSKVTDYLNSEYGKYSLEKIQIQYSGGPDQVLAYLRNKEIMNSVVIHLEIVISAKVEGSYVMYECLFSEKGDFVARSQIMIKRTDNIEY